MNSGQFCADAGSMALMKTVFAGDSITEGITGDSYLKLVQKRCPRIKAVNLGLGGDTLLGITGRLKKYLKKHDDVELLFLQAGHNDIILPSFMDQGASFRTFSLLLEKRGSVPVAESSRFGECFARQLQEIRSLYRGKFWVLTLSCVNEHPDSPTDRLRREYNSQIRAAVQGTDVRLIDVGRKFDLVLQDGGRDYRTRSVKDVLLDSLLAKLPNGSMSISEKRELELTIDGVHLNTRGAQLYAGLIAQAVETSEKRENI